MLGAQQLRCVNDERTTVPRRDDIWLCVALQALAVGNALSIEHSSNRVWRMAIHARRQDVSFFLPQLTPDHLLMDSFDLDMAPRACSCNILPSDGRPAIGVRENKVGRVTGRAVGRDNKACPEQSLPVNTLRVIVNDIGLVDISLSLHGSSSSITTAMSF